MSLLEFVKDAGAKVLDAVANPADAGRQIRSHIEKEIGVSDVDVQWIEGTVKVSGNAKTQADKERLILAAGNIQGVKAVDDAITVAAPGAASRMYTVKAGDTLGKIAKEHYGDASKYPQIFEANKPQLKDPDKIYPGQVLRIP
ncbi:peptidoglycan-binding protein LysM [Tahibacter amnicola]|uniref:Peptidoglycan-binding protein LysM n=1 Tax=Tahibacter amnicola TaxID=2976241 RepID=A0ABY6B8M5_9GAMM|nr:peptidoglycan-binding protein LysM [Tahibacter amnicola]UXI65917.1 peptidoglycan-binding protein LysM [Tahibacter amnicola]